MICLIFSLVATGFEGYFLYNPCTCFLEDRLCCAIGTAYDFFNGNFNNILAVCSTLTTGNRGDYSKVLCRSEPTGKIGFIEGKLVLGIVVSAVDLISIIQLGSMLHKSNKIDPVSSQLEALSQSRNTSAHSITSHRSEMVIEIGAENMDARVRTGISSRNSPHPHTPEYNRNQRKEAKSNAVHPEKVDFTLGGMPPVQC